MWESYGKSNQYRTNWFKTFEYEDVSHTLGKFHSLSISLRKYHLQINVLLCIMHPNITICSYHWHIRTLDYYNCITSISLLILTSSYAYGSLHIYVLTCINARILTPWSMCLTENTWVYWTIKTELKILIVHTCSITLFITRIFATKIEKFCTFWLLK